MRLGGLTRYLTISPHFKYPGNIAHVRVDGEYGTNGRWLVTQETVTPISGNLQPASGQDILKLEEADRLKTVKNLFTHSNDPDFIRPLRSGDDGSPADIIVVDGEITGTEGNYAVAGGERFIVMKVESFDQCGHLEVMIIKEGPE